MNKEEKLFLFNPFILKNAEVQEIAKMYQEVYNGLIKEPNTMYEYAHNVEVYSNLIYICGEIIARLRKDIDDLKTKIKIDTAINMVNERKAWSDGKPPAISYFEALATRMSKDDINKLADKECSYMRFKSCYEAIEEKINALKKRMDAIRFEEI